LREKGGAYGAAASFNSLTGVFGLGSYRDPGHVTTLQHFKQGITWLSESHNLETKSGPELTEQNLLEAKLSLISALDHPLDAREEGSTEFVYGITAEQRQKRREMLLKTTLADVNRAVQKHLLLQMIPNAPRRGVAVLGSDEAVSEISKQDDFEVWKLV
jgi:presequence protease